MSPGTAALGALAPTQAIASLVQSITSLTANLDKLMRSIQQAAGPLERFVGAFDPGTVALFDALMRDLSATIGYALKPLLDAVNESLLQLLNELAPAMAALRPIIVQLAAVMGQIMRPLIVIV